MSDTRLMTHERYYNLDMRRNFCITGIGDYQEIHRATKRNGAPKRTGATKIM
jgi:hypothetical protein